MADLCRGLPGCTTIGDGKHRTPTEPHRCHEVTGATFVQPLFGLLARQQRCSDLPPPRHISTLPIATGRQLRLAARQPLVARSSATLTSWGVHSTPASCRSPRRRRLQCRLLSFAIDPQLRICNLCRTAYPRRTCASALSQSPLWCRTDHLRETQRTHAERFCPFDRIGSASLTHSRGQEVGFADRCSELAWRTHAHFTVQHRERVN